MANAEAALGAAEIDRLFSGLSGSQGLALAVSGGPDSTALMLLVAAWLARVPMAPPTFVFTVDHGLRTGSAAEAAVVAARAAALGLPHATLSWSGPKPAGNLQGAARAARYRLLAEAAVRAGADRLVTAHTRDDQAETFLINLARGSGVYGLAAMPAERPLGAIKLVRPFLDVPKARLIATLTLYGESWIEDPSNADPRFARAGIRRAMGDLAALGLDRDRLAATARRMARTAAAIDAGVDDLLARAARLDPGGFAGVDVAALAAAPEEIGLRALARLAAGVGGNAHPPRLDRLESLAAAMLGSGGNRRRTLGGVVFDRIGSRLWLVREFGRRPPESLDLAPGEATTWDDRFTVALGRDAQAGVSVRPLGAAGRRRLRPGPGIPGHALASVPAAFRGDVPVAVPAFGYVAGGFEGGFRAEWTKDRSLRGGEGTAD